MLRERRSVEALERRAAKLGIRATYFPMEGVWSAWKDNKQIAGDFYYKGDALAALFTSR